MLFTLQLRNNQDAANTLQTKRNATDTSPIVQDSSQRTPDKQLPRVASANGPKSVGIEVGEVSKVSCRAKFAMLVNSKYTDTFIIVLIVIYVVMVLISMIIDEGSCTTNQTIIKTLRVLKYIEIGILSIFIIEIIVKSFALGIKVHAPYCSSP